MAPPGDSVSGFVIVVSKWRGVLCMHLREREMEMQMGGEGRGGDRRERWGEALYAIEGTGNRDADGW